MDFNKVIITGNLVRDPETKPLGDDSYICKFTIATNGYKDKVNYFDIAMFGKMASPSGACGYLSKGRRILLEGELIQNIWDDPKTGQKNYKVEIRGISLYFLDSKKQNLEDQSEIPSEINNDQVPF